MGIFDFLRGQPSWAKGIPEALRPTPAQVAAIEEVRRECGLRHEEIGAYLAGHRFTTERVLRNAYQAARQDGAMSERKAIALIIWQRVHAGSLLFGLMPGCSLTDAGVATAHLRDVDHAIEAVLGQEAMAFDQVPTAPGYEDVARRIDSILET